MSLRDSVKSDYKLAGRDFGETVTFTVSRDGAETTYTVSLATSHELKASEVASSGGYFQQGDREFALGREQIPDVDHYPRPGDRIVQTSDGTAWRVVPQGTRLDTLHIRFLCTCRKER